MRHPLFKQVPLVPRNLKPVNPSEAKIRDAGLEFYLAGEMISEDEYRACLRGDMTVVTRQFLKGNAMIGRKMLMNLNTKHPTLKTGESAVLYPGRALDITADLLLGEEPKERGGKD